MATKEQVAYASRYSNAVWQQLMINFDKIKDYHISCNDVSDLVMNAILDAFNDMKEFEIKENLIDKVASNSAFDNFNFVKTFELNKQEDINYDFSD
jgi:hypothetical protein